MSAPKVTSALPDAAATRALPITRRFLFRSNGPAKKRKALGKKRADGVVPRDEIKIEEKEKTTK
jgi:hypothetical protein